MLRTRVPDSSPLLDAGLAESFQSQANGLVPQFRGALTARIALPKVATAPFRLEDTASAAAISVALQGAHDVPATVADGYVLFERAHASGATVLHRALPEGTEDVLSFDSRPSTSEVSYVVTLDASVRGLRLVENTLEMLDANGAPRLRVAPPYVLGADHAVTHASLIVRGCAFDTNPAPPWGRVVTPPGASSCTVSIRWDDSRVTYPALLDPRWTSTQSMSGPRQGHTATLLSTGKLLVAGGSNGSSELASAELYDRLTNTWATTGSMTGVRRLHSAVQLGTTSSSTTSGKVFVVGGIQGSTSRTSSELYSVSAGTWVLGANMSSGRHQHTATLLSNGQVLIAGGMTGTSVLDTAALYNPASGTGTWTATSNMASARRAHTAVLLSVPGNATLNNKVLVVGGNSGTGSLSSVQLFSGTSWSTLTALPTPREGHTMTTLANGNVLVTGGTNGSTVLSTALVFNAATGSGSWSTTGAMTSVRQAHTATLLPSGSAGTAQVVVAGGSNGTLSLDTAETWNGTVWSASTSLPAKVQGHTATLLPNNTVLVAGGVNGTTTTSTTALFDASFANACTTNAQCASGFCVSGVCCDTACNGGCGSCNLPGKVGICSPQAAGTVCRSAPAGSCDASELCSGTGLACPADVNAPDGTPCNDGLTCTIGESCQAGACKPSAPATCTSGSSVTFYQSYDNGTTVDVAGGPKTPRGANAIIPAPGLFGPGIDGNTATEISYVDPTGTNISLAKPGSVSYWMKTQDGHIPLEFEVFDGFPRTNLYAVDRGSSGIGADVYFLNGASTGPSILQSGLSGFPVSGWANDGRWHLVVINWTPTKLGVSLDGGPLALTDVGWMQSDHVFASSVGSLLYVGGTNTGPGGYLGAGDELIVLNRAMSTPEIQWYWAQRTAGGPAVKNPAPAYFNAVPAACNQWDDLNPCTTDACTQAGGVTHSVVPNATACSDGDACNGAETCQAGACTAGPPPTASDECPTNGCNPTDPNCIMPKFEGIIAGTPARAVFSYRNLSGQNVNIPYGTNNGLSDGTGFIAAPSVFPPVWLLAGQQRNVFITPITGTLTWNIYGSSATATVTGTPIPVTSTAQGPQGALSDGTPFQMDFDPSYGIVATDTASAGVTVGKTSGGSFAVTADGAASYKLPLWVPPGRGGFQPNLALEYNSRHGSGHLGVGWALAGMSELSRCDKTVAVDAVAAEPAFAAGDALCLDGRRLVPVSGSGGDGTVYWEAETSFNQIIQHGDLSHPTTFEVRHPDGSVALYDKAVVPNASPAPERAWLLGSVRDKASNVLKYHYLEVNGIFAREYAVDRIDYVFSDTAETVPTRSVVFNYELNAKLDDKMVWQQEQMISRRIKSIDLLGPNPTTTSSLRSYKLAYDVGALSGRDRLVSVTECVHDSADVCKRPTTFKYSDDTSPKYQLYTSAYCETTWPLSGYSGYGTTSSHSREKVVDINGDGLDDVLDVFYDYSIDIFFQTPDGSGSSQGKAGGRFATRLSDGTKLGPEIDLSSQLPGIGDMEYYPVDIDGDGLTDIIAPDQANGNVDTLTPYYLYHNDSVRGAATPQVANGACKTTSTNIHFTKSAQPILQIQPDPTPSVERPYFRSRPYLADTDGDGLLDLLQGYGVATPGQQAWAGYQWEWSHGLPGGSFAAPSNVVFQTSGYLTGPYGFLHETILGTKLHQRAGRSWLIPTSTRNISIAGATVFRNVFQAFDVDGSGHTSAFDPLLHDDQVPASVAVDMNGDGLPEMVKVAAYPESCDAQGHTCPQVPESIFFAQNVDGHFTSDKVTSQMTRWTSSGMNAFSIDYNQDGWQDLVLLFENRQAGQESWGTYPGSVHPGVYVSSRTDFQAPVGPTTSSGTAVPSLYLENGTRLRATAGVGTAPEGPNSLRELHYATPFDVNGDGLSDLLLGPDVYVRQGGKVDLLTGVVDGEAHDTVVSYRPLGDRGPMYPNSSQPFYAHGTDVSYPLASEDKGIWAVASVAVDSGQSVRSADPSLCASCGVTADSSYNWFYYGYEGARTNLRTEEWLGFTKRIVYDAAHGRTTTTTYDTSQTVFGAYNLGKFHPITEETLLSVPAHDTGLYVNQALNYRRHVDYHYRTHFPAASAGANVFLLLPYQIIEDESDTGSSILPTRHVTTTFGYDNYGNVTSKTEDHTGVESLRQTTTYDNRTTGNTWLLGLPQLVTETSTPVNGDPPVTRETDHTYDARGFLWTETIEPHGDVSVRRVRSLERNLYGSIRKVTETDGTGQSRLTETTYDAAGMFPATTINALGQVTKTTYHPGYGFLVFVTDPNEATSKTRYDRFGRQKLTETADRQQLSSSYLASARTNTAYAVSQVATDGRATQSHFSRLDLETARYTLLPDGSNGVVQKSYDRFGQVAQQLSPAVVNASFVSTTTNSYDARDRLIRVVTSGLASEGSTQKTVFYAGNTVATVEPVVGTDLGALYPTHVVDHDELGRPTTATDYKDLSRTSGVATSFSYGAFGTLRSVQSAGVTTTHVYDVRGRETSKVDASSGTTGYTYDAWNNVTSITDANLNTTARYFDAMNRLKSEDTYLGTDSYDWDSAPFGIGKPAGGTSASGVGGTHSATAYDWAGHLVHETWTIHGRTFDLDYDYNLSGAQIGKLQRVTYPAVPGRPNRVAVEYRYSPVNGALLSLGPPGGSVNYYSIDARDPAERVAQETYGTATSRTLGYHSIFNLLASAKATQGGTVIQDLVLTYDGRRDLSTRTDNAVTLATPSGTSEGFHYDALGRLRQWVSFLGSYSVDYQYDDMGNMTSRQVTQGGTTSPADVFHFAEHGRSAQQLTSAPWGAYDYDAVGDQVTGPGRTVGYAPFHLPVSVAATGGSTQLEYDAWHHRSYKQSGSGNITYVTGAYERRADAAGVHHIVHLSAEGREVGELAVDESAPTAAPAERYLLADQLGEPLVIVEPNGQVVRPRLEPFGTRLSSGDTPSPGNSGDPSVHIGFGGSEHDDELGLINMNGRLYDPRISRFLSVDPLVASLRFSQAHHRYAYAFNSPLSHFDPSGFLTEGPDQSQESAWESACRLHGECGMSVIDFTHATSTGNQGQTCADVGTSDTFGNSAGQSSASDPGAEGTTVETPYITVETSGYSYIRDRVIGKETPGNSGTSSSAVMKQLQQNPNKFFPFRVNAHDPQKTGGAIMDREKYNLNGFDPHLDLPPGDHPVEVTNVTPTSFTFVTQKGHFDPPGSTITFRTYTDASGSIHLVHEAHTTPAGLSFVPLAAPSFAAKAWDYQETMLGMYLQQQQSNFTPSLPKSPF